jgi:hypothetical protein
MELSLEEMYTAEYPPLQGGNLISVTWNNSTSNGTIKVKSYNCVNAASNQVGSVMAYHILSINGVTPGTITGQANVPYNSNGGIIYSCPPLLYPNRGTGDPSTLSVSNYKWLIPKGWSLNGQVSDGVTPFINLTNSISPLPDQTTSGTIKVWGHSNLGPGYNSNPQTAQITRVFPTIIISATTTNTNIQGDKTPITLSVPNWSYARYSWTVPATWLITGKQYISFDNCNTRWLHRRNYKLSDYYSSNE